MSSKTPQEDHPSRSTLEREKIKAKLRAICSIKLLMIMGFALQAAIPILIIIIVTVSKQEQMIMSHSHDIANILRKRIHDNVDAYMNSVVREASQVWFQNQYQGFDPYDLMQAQKVMYPSLKYSNVTAVYYTRIDRDFTVQYVRKCDDPKCPINFIYAIDNNFYDQEVGNYENGTTIPNFKVVAHDFRLTTEEWHIRALQLEQGGFSEPIYLGNTMWSTEPAVWLSLFLPIKSPTNNSQIIGIAGSDYTLTAVNSFLNTLNLSPRSAVYIVETDTGYMIAGSHEKEKVYKIENGKFIRLRLRDSDQPIIGYIGAMLQLQYGTNFSAVRPQIFNVDNITVFVDPIQFTKLNLRWTVLAMVSVTDYMQPAKELQTVILVVDLAVLVVAVILGLLFSFIITNPLSNMTNRMRKNVFFNVERSISRNPRRRSMLYEVSTLQCNFAKMENAVNGFMKYVPREVVLNFINHPTQQKFFQPGVDPADIAIMFTDIEEFTSISETLQPAILIKILTDYLEAVSSAIKDHGGTLDKYIGDAVMALFNCPMKLDDYITKACHCAVAIRDETAKLNITNQAIGLPAFKTRIGLNAGTCLVGNIGSSFRLSYTAIGDAVNLASRIESLNKHYGTYLLISKDCYDVVRDKFLCRDIDKVAVKGRTQGVKIYEIINSKEKMTAQEEEFAAVYNNMMSLYFDRQFAAALWEALKFEKKYPFDKAVKVMLDRLPELIQEPPAPTWDGSTIMREK